MVVMFVWSGIGGEEQEAGEPGHGDDAVQPPHVQQGELPVDQVRSEVPVGHIRPPVPADAGLLSGGAGARRTVSAAARAVHPTLYAALHRPQHQHVAAHQRRPAAGHRQVHRRECQIFALTIIANSH